MKHGFLINKTTLWSGEEFVIIVPNTSIEKASELAERIRSKIEEYNFHKVGKITVSLVVVQFKGEDIIDTFIKRADDVMYKAKANGKNKVETIS